MNPFVKVLKDIIYTGLESFGRYYSKYRAFVVDNEDPEGQGRLRLVIPGIADNPMDYWAWGVGQFSGEGYGCKVTPPKGSMVWVEFEMGDPNVPIWSHGHFARVDKIPEEEMDPNIFWFKTPNGHKITFNDSTGEIGFLNKNGDEISLTEKGVSTKTKGKIFLGDKEQGGETAALGNKTADVLQKQNESLINLNKSLTGNLKANLGFFTKFATAANPLGAAALLITEGPAMVKNITDTIKSTDTVNKSLSNLTKEIPLVKSKKVVIEK